MGHEIIVVYKSKTGFTKRYAQMIADEIGCAIADFKSITIEVMSKYDTVIFGSRSHAGRIDGYKKAKELFEKSSSKNFIVFATGATPNDTEEIINDFWKQNLPADELMNVPHFYMQSGMCYEKMGLLDRMMMKMVRAMLKQKKDKDEHEKGFEHAISSSYDISSKEYIKPLVSHIKESIN